jgi:hypothetical protein
LSIQSVATFSSEASAADLPAEPEDSILTTSSSMGGKKGSKSKKAAGTKGRKTKAKKDDPIGVIENDAPEEGETLPAPSKPARGHKRGSDAMGDSVLMAAGAPAAKKRATRTRGSNAMDMSVLSTQDADMVDAPPTRPPAKGRKARGSTKSTRKASAMSIASTASTASLRAAAGLNDDELDRQLDADLDRPLTDNENIMADTDSDQRKTESKAQKGRGRPRKGTTASQESNDFAMFDPAPHVPNEGAIDADFKALQDETRVVEQEPLEVPKKGRKAGTRKVSKQTKAKKTEEPAPHLSTKLEPEVSASQAENPAIDENDDSIVSTATVVKSTPPPKKRGRPRKSGSSQPAVEEAKQPEAPQLAMAQAKVEAEMAGESLNTRPEPPPKSPLRQSFAKEKVLPPPPATAARQLPVPPSTPGKIISPAPSARQAALSPSQSPQSSDAENQPPSSKPAGSAAGKRILLAPVAATPARAASPSKRNVIAGLQSTLPWTAVDMDKIFGSPKVGTDKENVAGGFLRNGTKLTSPERRMTVEEWIYHNAGQAEQKLKHECETLVNKFENEGTRAMNVLEGLIAE